LQFTKVFLNSNGILIVRYSAQSSAKSCIDEWSFFIKSRSIGFSHSGRTSFHIILNNL
jgi:hypothetical protein